MEKTVIKGSGDEMVITLRKVKHPRNGMQVDYLSFTNGIDTAGVYLADKSIEDIVKFLSPKKKAPKKTK